MPYKKCLNIKQPEYKKKANVKSYNRKIKTNFHNNKTSKDGSQFTCLSVILINCF